MSSEQKMKIIRACQSTFTNLSMKNMADFCKEAVNPESHQEENHLQNEPVIKSELGLANFIEGKPNKGHNSLNSYEEEILEKTELGNVKEKEDLSIEGLSEGK